MARVTRPGRDLVTRDGVISLLDLTAARLHAWTESESGAVLTEPLHNTDPAGQKDIINTMKVADILTFKSIHTHSNP